MKVLKLAAMAVAIILFSALAPASVPLVQPAEAAAGWHNRTATWWFDDSSDNGSLGSNLGLYRVKMTVSWQTTDPRPPCFVSQAAAPNGTWQRRFLPAWIYRCDSKGVFAIRDHWYPTQNVSVSCWVDRSLVVAVHIDVCGQLADPQTSHPYWWTPGSIFSLCLGIPNTPFSWCNGGFRSRLLILGSSITVWNDIE